MAKEVQQQDIRILSDNGDTSCQDDQSSSRLEPEVEKECLQAFDMFDHNKDGSISFDELCDVMRVLGNNPKEEEMKKWMHSLDKDHDGRIDRDEFKTIMLRHWKDPVDEEEELKKAFSVFDRDGDGFVVAEEIIYVMKGLGHDLTHKDVTAIISEADVDGDGRLNYTEFVKVMQGNL